MTSVFDKMEKEIRKSTFTNEEKERLYSMLTMAYSNGVYEGADDAGVLDMDMAEWYEETESDFEKERTLQDIQKRP